MLISIVLLASLPAAEPLKVLVLDLRADQVPAATSSIVRDEIAVVLGHDERLDVLSTEDLRRVVSVEAQKEALGCDEASCLAEMGAALGARYIVHGSMGVLGSTTVVQLSLFDSESQRAVARETVETKVADELLPGVRKALDKIRVRMLGASPAMAVVEEKPALSTGLLVGGGVGALGAAGVVVGSIMMGLAAGDFYDLDADPVKREAAQGLGQAGTVVAVAGAVVAGAGAGAFFLLE